jgi:hypothetical protein
MNIKVNKVCMVAKNTLENVCTPFHLVSDHNPLEKTDSAQSIPNEIHNSLVWKHQRGKERSKFQDVLSSWEGSYMSYVRICFSLSHIILKMLMVWERSLVLDCIFVLNCSHPSSYALIHIMQGDIKIACGK